MKLQSIFFAVLATIFLANLESLSAAEASRAADSAASPDKKSTTKSTSGRGSARTSEQRLIAAVNHYRARFKLAPLKADATLMRVARERVPYVDASMSAGRRGYNHNACGLWCREHARNAGFSGPATDNLAMGYETPEGAVGGWASEDHDRDPAGHNYQMRGRAKINGRWVDERYNRIGVAIRGRNYIAIFGRRPTEKQNVNSARRT
jgi:uncharacterized protein YkwD